VEREIRQREVTDEKEGERDGRIFKRQILLDSASSMCPAGLQICKKTLT